MKNNKGVTLVELVVVIAIISVLTTGFALSFTLISRQRVSNAASTLKQTIQLAQTYAKSKENCVVEIKGTAEKGSNSYIYTFSNKDADKRENWVLGNGPTNINRKITTKVKFKGQANYIEIGPDIILDIYFDRRTGGFENSKIIKADGTVIATGIPERILFTNSSKNSTLVLAEKTGVITYEGQ